MRSGRYLARRSAVQALYQWQMTHQPTQDIEGSFIKNEDLEGPHLDYFKVLIENIPDKVEQLDSLMLPHLNRSLDSVDVIEHAILLVGVYELKYQPDVPVSVVLDEAIELAKTFASENSYKYVNGVLDKVAGEVRGDI